MGTKLVLKRLSATDLTIFEFHHRRTKGKQKAINLDKAVFFGQLYPDTKVPIEKGEHLPVDLVFYGPRARDAISLRQHVALQDKNLRLGAALIYDSPGEPDRFSPLAKDDFVVIAFVGDAGPASASMCFIARSSPEDSAIYDVLMTKYGPSLSERKSMVVLDHKDVITLLDSPLIANNHPIFSVIDADDLEDAVQGGEQGLEKVRQSRPTRDISKEEFQRAKERAEKVGADGEALLNAYFALETEEGRIDGFEWTAATRPMSPYDFQLHDRRGKCVRYLDAKSTGGPFENAIHVSMGEFRYMAESSVPYDLYRLYAVTETSARLRIAKNVGAFASALIDALKALPDRVRVDGFSLDPSVFEFGEELVIDVPELEAADG